MLANPLTSVTCPLIKFYLSKLTTAKMLTHLFSHHPQRLISFNILHQSDKQNR